MSDQERIERLEFVLGTLIMWLHRELGSAHGAKLLAMLESDTPMRDR